MKPADGRFALYLLAPLVGTFLGTLPGFHYDAARDLITIQVGEAMNAAWGLLGGSIAALGVYARWAKR